MKTNRILACIGAMAASMAVCALVLGQAGSPTSGKSAPARSAPWKPSVVKTAAEWHKVLAPDQFEILRRKGTEPAFTGKYAHTTDKGTYLCAACGNELFSSDTKFDSGTGWPSFWQPLRKDAVHNDIDRSFGEERTEVLCYRCGGHLGHVFEDGPKPTGLRYCMNSAALKFKAKPAPK